MNHSTDHAGTITNVAVVGAGYMGTGILQVLASSGLHCVFADVDGPTAQAAHVASLHQTEQFQSLGYFTADQARAIRSNSSWANNLGDAVRDAHLVVEAVSEDVDIKKLVLGQIADLVSDDTILATNTSSIPISILATAVPHAERLYGMHWFNPAQFLPCVEIIEPGTASPAVTERLMLMLHVAGRQPVVVADSPGFVANRLQFALFREAALMVEENLITADRLDEVVRGSFGYRLPFFGPFAIADMAGLDIYAAVFDTLERTLGERFSCPPGLRKLVDAGRLGVKTGSGYSQFDTEQQRGTSARRDRAYVTMAHTLTAWQTADTIPA